MRVFQIQKKIVLIINNEKQYTDTIENFKLDSNINLDNIKDVIYDDYQELCVINKEFKIYPNTNFDSYIDNIDVYIKSKEKREYVPPLKPTINELKTSKIADMKAERDTREVQNIEYNGKTFDYDDKSRERLTLSRQSLEDNKTESILWTCADNTFATLTLEDFKAINTLSATRSTQLHEQYNKLKLLINSLETEEQIKEVTFDTDTSTITLNTGN